MATALLLVGAVAMLLRRPITRPAITGVALGGTLIDLDHIPAALGWNALVVEGSRPFTHSLTTLVPLF